MCEIYIGMENRLNCEITRYFAWQFNQTIL